MATVEVNGMKLHKSAYASATLEGLLKLYADGTLQAAIDNGKNALVRLDNATYPRPARFVVGTSKSGWTADDCDYLCDGVDDQEEINAAIDSIPSGGGEVLLLDGTYNLSENIRLDVAGTTLSDNGEGTKLVSQIDVGVIEVLSDSCTLQNLLVKPGTDAVGITISSDFCIIRGCRIDSHRGDYGICVNDSCYGAIIIGNEIYSANTAIYLDGSNAAVVGNYIRGGESTPYMCWISGLNNLVVGNNAAECSGPFVAGSGNVVVGNVSYSRANRGNSSNLVIEDDPAALQERITALEARIVALEGHSAAG